MSAASASLDEFRSAAATDTGLLREHNEDCFWIDRARGIFLVVDGVGGHAAGEIAAPSDGRWTEAMRESYADRIERRLAAHIVNWTEITERRITASSCEHKEEIK